MQVEEIIVADSSPLIGLARIRRLEILRQLARRVAVPPAVWKEIIGDQPDASGARELAAVNWIEVQAPYSAAVSALLAEVDPGEAEAIALATLLPAAVLLMDDLPRDESR